MPRRSLASIAISGIAALALSCGNDAASEPSAAPTENVEAASAQKTAAADAHRRDERPLPAFSGRTLDGVERNVSSFIGKRLVLFFFNPEVEESEIVADAISGIASERSRHNFEIVGVGVGSTASKTRTFAEAHGLEFEIFDDSSAVISGRLGMRSRVAVLGVDPEGYLLFGMGAFPTEADDASAQIEAQIRDSLRLPEAGASASGVLDSRPSAPDFEARQLDGNEPFSLSSLKGQGVVLVFFLHTCPHCHAALRFFKKQFDKMPAEQRPVLLGLSVQDRPSEVRSTLKDEGLDFFRVLFDPTGEIQAEYGVFGAVPDIMMIDASGRIERRIEGWQEERDPALARMVAAKIAGLPIPMLLNPKGYTGNDVCGVCHTTEHDTWQFTNHASAFDTLVTHGDDRDGECVSCHVVGFEKPGGYNLDERPRHLENVGCETCHGRGGPHLSPGFVKESDYAAVCQTCHNPTHSLGFDYATFRPKISHAAVVAMTAGEREAMLEGRGKPRDVLGSTAEIVGSEACQSCHEAEYATWKASPHAHAVKTLDDKGESANAECLVCHTTGFGRPGGFPKTAAVGDQPDLARVGCESCHGAGGEHVAEGARRLGSIVSLGDKCDSCVVLQICGSCHDEANDPGFRFSVEERIEAQRHGTIEAGTGKPLGDTASLGIPAEETLARVFATLDAGG